MCSHRPPRQLSASAVLSCFYVACREHHEGIDPYPFALKWESGPETTSSIAQGEKRNCKEDHGARHPLLPPSSSHHQAHHGLGFWFTKPAAFFYIFSHSNFTWSLCPLTFFHSAMHKPVDHTASPLMSSAVYLSSGGEEAPISRYHVIGSASQVRPWYLMPLSAFCNFPPQASSSSLILVSLKQECVTTHNRAL